MYFPSTKYLTIPQWHKSKLSEILQLGSLCPIDPPLAVPPYAQERNFQGRKEILAAISKKFKHPGKHRVVLHGIPGIG
jgi:hypothetical protein